MVEIISKNDRRVMV